MGGLPQDVRCVEMEQAGLRIEPLTRRHDRATFSCGEASLDRYLQKQASQDLARGVAAVFVIIDARQERVAGYYTLSSAQIALDTIPEEMRRRLPRYPDVPAVLLGRLAVDEAYRGRRLGQRMLVDAFQRVQATRQNVTTWAIIVDALNDRARLFYEYFGFVRLQDDPYRLFLPMSIFEAVLDRSH